MGIYEDRGSTLQQAKDNCLAEIEVWYGYKVLDVFDCDVLGPMYRYYCSEQDQLRMINGKISNIPITLICGLVPADPNTDPIYTWMVHSATEGGKVHTAYMQFSNLISQQYTSFKQRIAAATTLAEMNILYGEIVYGV